MRVLLFGATGMVGSGALIECLADVRVESVLVVGRSSCGVTHPKLREIIHGDFYDFGAIEQEFADRDACFFCLGVSAAGLNEAEYTKLTYYLTLAAARACARVRSSMTFCYVSGEGTDSTEQGLVMWARVKGKTENALLALPFKAAYMFRPAYIHPMKGVRTKTRLYSALYAVLTPIYPVLRRFLPMYVTTTETLGRAMIEVVEKGYSKKVLRSADINRLGA